MIDSIQQEDRSHVERREEVYATSDKDVPFRKHQLKKHTFSEPIRQQLKSLRSLNNYSGLLAVIEDCGVITLAIGSTLWLWQHTPIIAPIFYVAAVIVIGFRQRALATLLHEAAHKILAQNKQLNYLLGTYLSGYLVFQTFHRYVQSHCREHHGHLGNPNKDPDLKYYGEQGLLDISDRDTFFEKYLIPNIKLHKLFDNIGYLITNRLLMPDFKNQSAKYKREYAWFVAYWVVLIGMMLYYGIFTYFLLFWILPYLTAFQITNCLIEVCEHYPLLVHSKKEMYMTRNRNGHWFEQFCTGIHNENYHLIHHLFPIIPFWKLPQAHQILLQDEEYRLLNEYCGGIITRSKADGKTILESMFEPLPTI